MQRQSAYRPGDAAAMAALSHVPVEVVISRNSQTRRWEIVLGSHRVATKWFAHVDPMRVATAIRRAARGPVNVVVDL